MRIPFAISVILAVAMNVSAQNQLDDQGRKSGRWKVEHPNGRTLYEAEFVEGRPVGEMIRYYENGAVRARMWFDTSGIRSYARMYFENGNDAAAGWYVNQKKDSVWTYFSPIDGSVRIREPYQNGKLQGMVRKYYSDGRVSEELEWVEGQKQGLWKQYYESGALRLTAYYQDDLLNGIYEVNFRNGKPEIRGEMLDGRSHGTWKYFDDQGTELISLEFLQGIPLNRDKYDQWMQDSLEKYLVPFEPESIQNPQWLE